VSESTLLLSCSHVYMRGMYVSDSFTIPAPPVVFYLPTVSDASQVSLSHTKVINVAMQLTQYD